MYMAPIISTEVAASRPALRRALGMPVLVLASIAMVPWLAVNALVAGVVLAGKFGLQAMDYAGQIALGR